ncbi:Radical SAM superfamily protein [anaerobic digester metagenome]
MKVRHVFGPVFSRRLGRSLGIDLIPYKTCSYDCVYCECGPTTLKTTRREEFVRADSVLAELRSLLAEHPPLDSITMAGSGEPTLSLAIGDVIRGIKEEFPEYTISVLTNGSLLDRADVQNDLVSADRVIPTLSTVSQATFERIHRPCPGLRVDSIIGGIRHFREVWDGELWLEVFLVPPLNTTPDELAGLKEAVRFLEPDRVQLNTLDRPSAEGWVQAVPAPEMARISEMLGGPGTTVISRSPDGQGPLPGGDEARERICSTLARRPSTIDDLVRLTGCAGGEVAKLLGELEREGLIVPRRGPRGLFYTLARTDRSRDGAD